jgi:Ni/Co efflux regulator RcnB
MRKVLISLLLASAAATPALAADQPDRRSDRDEARAERQQAREDRQETRSEQHQERSDARVERQQNRVERQSVARPQVNGVRPDRPTPPQGVANVQRDTSNYVAPGPRIVRPSTIEQRRDARIDRRQERIADRRDRTEELRESRVRTRAPVVSNVPRPGTQPPLRTEHRRSHSDHHWNGDWRHDHRYDWSNWRHHHRSLFRLGFYFDPFGWGYQRYSIGWRMWPSYYSNRYWLSDPWQYRLPYAPAGYQWIRYYNDAVLVDTWTGEVVDVIYNFFW